MSSNALMRLREQNQALVTRANANAARAKDAPSGAGAAMVVSGVLTASVVGVAVEAMGGGAGAIAGVAAAGVVATGAGAALHSKRMSGRNVLTGIGGACLTIASYEGTRAVYRYARPAASAPPDTAK